MKILAVGDVCGQRAVEFIENNLRKIKDSLSVDFTVVNGENAADIRGISAADARSIWDSGADLITTGNHVWGKKDIFPLLDSDKRIIRPENYPAAAPGMGSTILNIQGYRFLCINVQGTVYLDPLDNPFIAVEKILKREEGNYDFSLLDIHAEASSEKIAMARYFDGRINVIWGTHTHVQTADECILPKGTGYITDIGMTGPTDGVIGSLSEPIIERFLTHMPQRFSVAEGKIRLCGALFNLDTSTGRVVCVERVVFDE